MAAPDSGKLCCLRCGKPVGEEPSERPRSGSAPGDEQKEALKTGTEHPSGYDGWELDEDLRHIGRVLGISASPSERERQKRFGKKHRRIDAAHGKVPAPHFKQRAAKAQSNQFDIGTMLLGAVAWTTLMLGLMASACGGVLLIWAAAASRNDLWNVGLPIAIAGLLALVVAMVLQIERLSGDNRQTAAKLERFDDSLVQIRRDAATSASESRPLGDRFYGHMADGVPPELLLTDLKSQLELLTQRLGQPEHRTSQEA